MSEQNKPITVSLYKSIVVTIYPGVENDGPHFYCTKVLSMQQVDKVWKYLTAEGFLDIPGENTGLADASGIEDPESDDPFGLFKGTGF